MSFVDNGVDFEEQYTISIKLVANFAIIIYNMVNKTVLLDVFVRKLRSNWQYYLFSSIVLPYGKTKWKFVNATH